jgi:adenylate kinase
LPYIALTGTPGTGKSTVAELLSRRYSTVEVGAFAQEIGKGHLKKGGEVVVDIGGTGRWIRRHPLATSRILVGHLSHLFPLQDTVVLRCHPVELGRRLTSARRGDRRSRRENMLAEAVSVVTSEALALGRNVFEIDTTDVNPAHVAREVSAWLKGPRRARWGRVDWLRDPSVTEHLLEWVG